MLQLVERRRLREGISEAHCDIAALRREAQAMSGRMAGLKAEPAQPDSTELHGPMREYRDALLICAISNRMVGERAASDEEAIRKYYRRNRKRYASHEPATYADVRPLVVADLQEHMERQWVAGLRKRYKVKVYRRVLDTVGKHGMR